MSTPDAIYGLVAEFNTPEELIAAVRSAHTAGYRKMDAYSPFPIEEVAEAMHFHESKLPVLVLIGGLAGAAIGFSMQYYASVIAYPNNIGGRPLNSWPAFIPVTFELTILFAAAFAVFGMLALNGLPKPYHPLFGDEGFSRVTKDGFFLCIESGDKQFDSESTTQFLERLRPKEVRRVAP